MQTTKKTLPATHSEMINDEHFIRFMKEQFNKLEELYRSRPEPKPGFKYRRTAVDILDEQGNLEFEFFLNNTLAIWEKRSTLSSNIRALIDHIGVLALFNTIDFYRKEGTDNEQPTGLVAMPAS